MTNRDVPLLKGTLRKLTASDIDSIDKFPDAGQTFHQRIAQQGERLTTVEARLAALGDSWPKTDIERREVRCHLHVRPQQPEWNAKVALTPHEIRGCVGVSHRYAYELIDAMAADMEGVSVRNPMQVRTSNGVKRKQKALVVDCEQVHVDLRV